MATYVLVHRGAHGGRCYGPVARVLRASGHEVHAPTMTGVGERSHLLRPDIDLDFHVGDILAVLHYEDLRDVILVGDSYGGMVITGVADRAPDRIGHIVYLDAAMPADDDIAWMTPRLTPHPWKCSRNRCGSRTRPRCRRSRRASSAAPRRWRSATARVARARAAGRIWDIDTGHDLMISEPEAVAELLLRVAAA